MSRYIDADALYKVVTERYSDITAGSYPYNYVAFDMANLVKKAPTADVVEVVRCKDCEHYEAHGNGKAGLCKNNKCKGIRYENDFCSYGERRGE